MNGVLRLHEFVPFVTNEVRVMLRTGGTLQILGNFKFMAFGRAERQLVGAIADAVQAYRAVDAPHAADGSGVPSQSQAEETP